MPIGWSGHPFPLRPSQVLKYKCGRIAMTALEIRIVWLEAIIKKFRGFMAQGGNLVSAESAFLAVHVFCATADLARTPFVQGTVREEMRLAPPLPDAWSSWV